MWCIVVPPNRFDRQASALSNEPNVIGYGLAGTRLALRTL